MAGFELVEAYYSQQSRPCSSFLSNKATRTDPFPHPHIQSYITSSLCKVLDRELIYEQLVLRNLVIMMLTMERTYSRISDERNGKASLSFFTPSINICYN